MIAQMQITNIHILHIAKVESAPHIRLTIKLIDDFAYN
jgi:hypothetical protein